MVLTRVFAVLASRNGSAVLPRTLDALDAQTVRPAATIGVDAASGDDTAAVMAGRVDTVVKLRTRAAYGQAIALGVAELPEPAEGDWLWLLAHDAEPASDALERLVAAADVNHRVAVVGPKVMRSGDARTINEFGETMTPYGNAVRLAAGELDQGQYDSRSDVLGVAETGLLIRREVFEQLGGFDPALTTADAGLDLGVRARLAGHQVVLQPRARVRRNGGAELFAAKSLSDATLTTIRRRAQLHRRFVYANPLALVLHWLLALPLAGIRSIGHLFAKRPAAVVSEFSAALMAMFSFGHVARARGRLRRARAAGWGDLKTLRIDWRTLRARRRLVGDDVVENSSVADERIGFVASGTLWVMAFALLAGVVVQLRVITSGQVTGGGLLPLGGFAEMWQGALFGDRDGLSSIVGPADPFAIITALLGSLTFWQPSTAVVIVLVLAPALATVTAWMLARRITAVAWAPPVAAAVWAFSPSLLTSLHDGRLGAVLAHVALPAVAYGVIRAGTVWRSAALGALALAIAVAGAPTLIPALVIAVVVAAIWFGVRGRLGGVVRAVSMLVPAAVLFAPLVWAQRDRLLAVLADPGIPLGYPAADALELAAGYPTASLGTLGPLLEQVQLAGTVWPMWGTIVLIAPLVLAAAAAPFLRALPGLAAAAVALAGFATAVAATRISIAAHGSEVVALWTGPGLSLAALGLLIGACVTIGVLDFRSGPLGSIITVFAALTGLALVIGAAMSAPVLQPAPERSLPALVVAAADEHPHVGTLVIEPLSGDSMRLTVARGGAVVLSDVQTITTADHAWSGAQSELSQFAVDLFSGSDVDVTGPLEAAGIGYVVLADATGEAATLHETARRGLDERGSLAAVGATDVGLLWTADAVGDYEPATPVWAWWLLLGQLLVLLMTLLLALPSMRRGARRRVRREPDARKDFA